MDTVLMIVVMGAALYFLMIRPQQKKAKEQQKQMSALAEGSRVMTVSGILGTIKHLGEKQVVIEISPGVEMTIDKRAIGPQTVEDEFEYSDDSTEATEVGALAVGQAALTEEASNFDSAEDEPVTLDSDAAEPPVTWENPDQTKN